MDEEMNYDITEDNKDYLEAIFPPMRAGDNSSLTYVDTKAAAPMVEIGHKAFESWEDALNEVVKEAQDHLDAATQYADTLATGGPVDRPEHYTRFNIEPVTFIMENNLSFHAGNIIKYICRAGYKLYDGKDAIQSEIIDLEKIRRYAEMRINQLNGEAL